MENPLLIKGIAEKITYTIKNLKLKPEIWPEKFIKITKRWKHRYSSICIDQKGKKVFFYAGLHKSKYEQNRMLTEVKLAQFFIKENLFDYFPTYIKVGFKKEFSWLIREFFPSSVIEHKIKIEKLKRELKEKEIKELASATVKMGEISVKKFSFLKKFKIERFFKMLKTCEDLFHEGVFTKEEYEKFKNLLEKNSDLIKREHKYFCHGDFGIGNILIFNDNLKIIDLESACINNFAFDIAFLTTRLWQDKETRKKIINYYFNFLSEEKKCVFPPLFQIDSFLIGLQSYYSEPTEYSTKELKKRKEYYIHFLKSCLTSFENLLNL